MASDKTDEIARDISPGVGTKAIDPTADTKNADPETRQRVRNFHAMMAQKEVKENRYLSYSELPKDYQRRIKNSLWIAAAWFGFTIAGAGLFLAARPWMDRRREEREKILAKIESSELK